MNRNEEEREETTIDKVVVNHEEQYSMPLIPNELAPGDSSQNPQESICFDGTEPNTMLKRTEDSETTT